MNKPEYVQFCNRIHLLDLQVSKGDMDGGVARRDRQALLADLVGSRTKSVAHKKSKQHTGEQTRRTRGLTRRPSSTDPPDQADSQDLPGEDNTAAGSSPVESECANIKYSWIADQRDT